MKATAPVLYLCFTLFFVQAGCSKEEEPLPLPKKPKVVKRIIRPAPEKAETSSSPKEPTVNSVQKKAESPKVVSVAEKAVKKPDTKAPIEAPPKDVEPGYYMVKKGDSLSSIASREEVYGDPLKWPILCRLNGDKLRQMEPGVDFPDRPLPVGIKLKFITPDEAKKNLEKRTNNTWVINVLSASTKKEIIPRAVTLVKNGYPAYITRAKVKGKDWMRLRVGFFESKGEADAEGKKIMAMLKSGDFWTTKAGKQELEGFGGY